MDECRECEGAILDCIADNGDMQCPRCSDKTDQWGKKIK